MMYLQETTSAMPYSKFAAAKDEKKQEMVPSKVGMLIIYVPALFGSLVYLWLAHSEWLSQYQVNIAAVMVMIHFLKRTLEVLFLHKYSGSTELSTARIIGFAYAFQALMICGTSNANPLPSSVTVGTVLFLIGIAGNFYHHYLLACLRGSDVGHGQAKQYVAPKGGFFQFVAAPHYLFELIGWLGIAVASEQVTAYIIFAGMVSYLSARSLNQNNWNKQKFSDKDWPSSRKNLIPFVY
jgi:very-long-chain enoyl-CoA reductase